MDPNNVIKLIDKEDYYKDSNFISFSGLKVFSKCETLYRDLFITKVYEEPERDYFVYGKLVDAMVTESPEFIAANFIRITRKIDPEDALKFENQINELNKEIEEKETALRAKVLKKQEDLLEKIRVLNEDALADEKDPLPKARMTPAKEKKLADLRVEANNMTMNPEEYLDKTLQKGIEARKAEVVEIQTSLDAIKSLADKQQVTPAVWENAESTALALKTHPYYSNMEFNELTSQQIFTCEMDGMPCKGKLDHLKLSPAITKFYAIYKAKQMTLKELKMRIIHLNHNDQWAVITDIKTCYSLEKLEPFNNHYRGQLGFYQDLVSMSLGIPRENIKCQILVADKVSNSFKKAELFGYPQATLDGADGLKNDIKLWMQIWFNAIKSGRFVSAKEKAGIKQKCFTCSECRFCPFARRPGEPVMVTESRFGATEAPIQTELSTADAVLDY